VAFRSDLKAAFARIQMLERKLRDAHRQIDDLENDRAEAGVSAVSAGDDLRWETMRDAVVDTHGTVYCLGGERAAAGLRLVLFSLSAHLEVRWVVRNLAYPVDQAGLALSDDRELLLWAPDRRVVRRFSTGSGNELPAVPHEMDLRYANSLTCDAACKIYVSSHLDSERLRTFDRNGALLSGGKGGFFSGLFGRSGGYSVAGDDIYIGWDEWLYGIVRSNAGPILTRQRSDGGDHQQVYLPLNDVFGRPRADRLGRAYVLGLDKDRQRVLARWLGGRNVRVERSQSPETDANPPGHETMFVVDPAGGGYLLGSHGFARYVSADGETRFLRAARS
jgi:hypothetical protein